eukprot:3640498-Rhodomonas_salina.4
MQVTFTVGPQYDINENSGLIPLDSVRAGKGTFFSQGGLVHKCMDYTDGSFADVAAFNASLLQPCAPGASMCVSPASIPDQFVVFNIPLGLDYFGDAANDLSNNIFVDMVISAVDTVARGKATNPNAGNPPWQMKTTLTASIPVVAGGINIFCDGITAKTDLKDGARQPLRDARAPLANVDIIVGSAFNATELTRLRILVDVASTQLDPNGPQQIDSDSIEAVSSDASWVRVQGWVRRAVFVSESGEEREKGGARFPS